jgi:DNA mismatch endonuclease (patch repair protein)
MAAGESTAPRRRDESWASTPGTRASMQSNRGRDTSPELAIRRRLHALGLRYRVTVRPIKNVRRTADIVFTRARVAVFIDGCFWHGCPEHYQAPARNAEFWLAKRVRNQERDAETDATLLADGWRVLRFWEHQVRVDPDVVAAEIARAVRAVDSL